MEGFKHRIYSNIEYKQEELGDYDKFKSTFTALDLLAPPIGHTQRNQGVNAYKNYTRVLRDHPLKKYTINKETSPRACRTLTRNQLNKDRFDILTQIIIKGSHQLGGDVRDLVNYVKKVKIKTEKSYLNFIMDLKQWNMKLNSNKIILAN